MSVYLIGYAERMLYSAQPTILLTNFENLNSIPNIFQEAYDFLALTDPLIICIYFGAADRHLLLITTKVSFLCSL